MKVQFGCGDNFLEGWKNLREHESDITKTLRFDNESVDFILAEHVLEHVTPQDGYRFLRECLRILKPGGVVRIIVPDIDKIWRMPSDEYRALVKHELPKWWPVIGWNVPENHTPSDRELIETLIFCHGHRSVYTADLLETLMETAGFEVQECEYGKSQHSELDGIDFHWRWMSWDTCVLESSVVEGTK